MKLLVYQMAHAATKAAVEQIQTGKRPPVLEFVMHPDLFMGLIKEAYVDGSMFLSRLQSDGSFEFMGHAIREDVDQTGWVLQPFATPRTPHPLDGCPFCGADGDMLEQSRTRYGRRAIACGACDCHGPSAPTIALAWAEWRRRFGGDL